MVGAHKILGRAARVPLLSYITPVRTSALSSASERNAAIDGYEF
jgi:hypothetical protein